jgi:hypothetical protein
VEALLDKKADVHAKDNDGQTPLHVACTNGQTAVVEVLLDKKADVHANDNDGNTPLHAASNNGHAAVVNALLANEADVNALTEKADTSLHLASIEGHVNVVRVLLAKFDVDINAKNKDNETPLHFASKKGHNEVVHQLLYKECDINALTESGWTPLHFAYDNGHVAVVQLLLDNGANPDAENNSRKKPYDLSFYGRTMELDQQEDNDCVSKRLEKISNLITDVQMLKIFYTVVASLLRTKVLSCNDANKLIDAGLEQSTKCAVCTKSVSAYKLVLDKAHTDGFVTSFRFNELDDIGNVNRMSEADFVKDIQKSVRENMFRINGLQTGLASINTSLNKLRDGIKHKNKVEGTIGMVSATLNIISFGVAGTALSEGIKLFLDNVVDYGDVAHLAQFAETNRDVLGFVKMRTDNAIEKYSDSKMDEFLDETSDEDILMRITENASWLQAASAVCTKLSPPELLVN